MRIGNILRVVCNVLLSSSSLGLRSRLVMQEPELCGLLIAREYKVFSSRSLACILVGGEAPERGSAIVCEATTLTSADQSWTVQRRVTAVAFTTSELLQQCDSIDFHCCCLSLCRVSMYVEDGLRARSNTGTCSPYVHLDRSLAPIH